MEETIYFLCDLSHLTSFAISALCAAHHLNDRRLEYFSIKFNNFLDPTVFFFFFQGYKKRNFDHDLILMFFFGVYLHVY